MTDQAVKDKLKAAVEQVRADLADLENEIPNWNSINISGTRKYRPIADRVVAGAQRLKALVTENTYSSR
jgi:hypothetical protein